VELPPRNALQVALYQEIRRGGSEAHLLAADNHRPCPTPLVVPSNQSSQSVKQPKLQGSYPPTQIPTSSSEVHSAPKVPNQLVATLVFELLLFQLLWLFADVFGCRLPPAP